MEFKIHKNNFINYHPALMQITSKKSIDDSVANIKIETCQQGDEKKLKLIMTDYETLLSILIDGEFSEHGCICVNALKFLNVIREFPDSEITIKIDTQRQWLYIKSEDLETQLSGMDPRLYPNLDWKEIEESFKIESQALRSCLKRVVGCIPDVSHLNYLKGMGLKLEEDTLEFGSSDSLRVSRCIHPLPERSFSDFAVNVPKKSCLEMISIMEKEEGDCEFYHDDTHIQIKTNNILYQSLLLRDRFPGIKKFFNSQDSSVLEVNREKILRFLKVLRVMAEDNQQTLKIVFSADHVDMISEKKQFEANDRIDCRFTGGGIESIGFNVNILYSGIQNFSDSSEDDIIIKFKSSTEACIISARDIENFEHLCMPMNLPW